MTSSASYARATSTMPARTVSGAPATVRRRGPALPLDARKRSALSGGGTAIRRPWRSIVNVILLARGEPLGLLVAVGAQRPDGDRGARRGEPVRRREALAVARGDLGAGRVDEV